MQPNTISQFLTFFTTGLISYREYVLTRMVTPCISIVKNYSILSVLTSMLYILLFLKLPKTITQVLTLDKSW
jgi:hypothetical protein